MRDIWLHMHVTQLAYMAQKELVGGQDRTDMQTTVYIRDVMDMQSAFNIISKFQHQFSSREHQVPQFLGRDCWFKQIGCVLVLLQSLPDQRVAVIRFTLALGSHRYMYIGRGVVEEGRRGEREREREGKRTNYHAQFEARFYSCWLPLTTFGWLLVLDAVGCI